MLELRHYLRQPSSPVALNDAGLPVSIRGFFGRLTRGEEGDAPADPADLSDCRLSAADLRMEEIRANAHAAYHSAEVPGTGAVDAALDVAAQEILRLRHAVETYGEALKTLQVYGKEAEQRAIAAQALRAVTVELKSAAPIPHLRARPRA